VVKARLLAVAIGFLVLTGGLWFLSGRPARLVDAKNNVRVLTYSGFSSSWGPGPEIAAHFKSETGTDVEFIDAGDAGLLLGKLRLTPADVVIGFDQFSIWQARSEAKWRLLPPNEDEKKEIRFREPEFLPFDWGPMAFVYRDGEVEPPVSLDDLLNPRFKGAIALEDPRTSSPGLQFLFWVLSEKGEEKGFEFLEHLKPQLATVSPSWSAAYGLFTKNGAKLAFSYLTSPVYHWVQEKNEKYKAAVFQTGHPVQVEYAAVPESCLHCEAGERFARYLLRSETQAIIMQKNYMLPVVPEVATGTAFEKLPQVKILDGVDREQWMKKRDDLFARWRKLQL
jgi:thiamine transport system substrate-binding protein